MAVPEIAMKRSEVHPHQIAGGSISFYGSGVGSNSVAYQWAFNGTNLAGATNASLTLTNVQVAQQGYYNFTVSSAGNSLASSNAYFYLVPCIARIVQSQNKIGIIFNLWPWKVAIAPRPFSANIWKSQLRKKPPSGLPYFHQNTN